MRLLTGVAAALAGVAMFGSGAAAQDVAKGEKIFKKCMACHKVGEGAKNGVGPQLNGIVGRTAGSVEGYAYSGLNKNSGAAGLVWTEEMILAYLADPNAFLKKFLTDMGKADQVTGATKMTFKLPKEDERKDVIAYLKQFTKP